jgi:hypothetical protein
VTNADMGRSHFSSDTNAFAVPVDKGVVVADIGAHTAKLALHDNDFGQYPTIAWGPEGTDLYVAGQLIGDTQSMLGQYDTGTGKFEVVHLDQGFGNTFVTAQNEEVQALLRAPTALPTDCTARPVGRPRAYENACEIPVTAQP